MRARLWCGHLLLVCALGYPAQARIYHRTDIAPLPGDYWAQATNINGQGQVVGWSEFYDYWSGQLRVRAFIWTPADASGYAGTPVDLTLGGFPEGAVPRAINDYGQIVGTYREPTVGWQRAFLWTPFVANGTEGLMMDLGTLFADASVGSSGAVDINQFGQVVGSATKTFFADHAFLWTPTVANGTAGSMIDLGTLDTSGILYDGGSAYAMGINDMGQVVGGSAIVTPEWTVANRAFLWDPAVPNTASGHIVDLGAPWDFLRISANDINDRGQIIGTAESSFYPEENVLRTYLWTPVEENGTTGTFADFGPLPAEFDNYDWQGNLVHGELHPNAINNLDEVAGWSPDANGNIGKAVLWAPAPGGGAGTFTNLGALTIYSEARGINDQGWVAGAALIYAGGSAHVWVPCDAGREIQGVIEDVAGVDARNVDGLGAKLEAAMDAYTRSAGKGDNAAIEQLKAFQKECDADSVLTFWDSARLKDEADDAIACIEG